MKKINQQVILASRPTGNADQSTWKIIDSPWQELAEGEVRIRNEYISLDPAMRGWISTAKSYIPPVEIGAVMRAGSIGFIESSRNLSFEKGDLVTGWTGVQQFPVTDGKQLVKINNIGIPLPKYLSVLGMPGFTAYFGLLDIGKPKAGETVLVSAAAGAVGSVVGQIAKIKGCRVVGIAGGAKKCEHVVQDLGFDACIDYKNHNIYQAIKSECSKGIDIYFDNVGGDILNIALTRLNKYARIPICGAISQYNQTQGVTGPSNYVSLLVNRARMEGFIVMDYAKQYKVAAETMAQWMLEGKLKSKEYIVNGIDQFPSAFDRLFSGDKMGKLVLSVK